MSLAIIYSRARYALA
ncbi:hypothetical protein ORI99_07305, partial [Alishewanella sp. SMS9]|nr:hypothetical protein [Alishewanella sp. SMS9]